MKSQRKEQQKLPGSPSTRREHDNSPNKSPNQKDQVKRNWKDQSNDNKHIEGYR
jgi:hypothetical protein